MIRYEPTMPRVVAVVSSLALLLAVLAARVTVEAQQQMSDNDVYRTDDDLYYSPASLAEEYSRGPSGLEHELLAAAAQSSDDLLARAQFEAMLQERYLRRLQSLTPEMGIGAPVEAKKDSSDSMLAHDLSSHWPAAGMDEQLEEEEEGSQLSQPVNDPEEFEAKLGQLTDALNHNMPNTRMRQQLLLGLLNNGSRQVDSGPDEDDGLELVPMMRLPQGPLLSELKQLAGSANSLGDDDDDASLSSSRTGDLEERSESSSTGYLARGEGGSEYIDRPLELSGHQFVQGGAGEGRQLLGPEGTFENVQVIKTDAAIPSYCDPPNPCPIGYTAQDGCLESFVNLASFSREYQAKQKCSCDNEHSLFNCAAPNLAPPATSGDQHATNSLESREEEGHEKEGEEDRPSAPSDKLDTLARTIQNRFGDLASVQRLIGKQRELHEKQQQQREALSLAGNDDENSDYLVRSARKLSSLDMRHKVNLD